MVGPLTLILLLAVAGDAIAEALGLPIPGPAIGLLLLTLLFVAGKGPGEGFNRLFDAVAPHFPLFFVPAAVGVVASAEVLSRSWFVVAAAIVPGTAITLVVTGRVTQSLLGARARAASSRPAGERGGKPA